MDISTYSQRCNPAES